MLANHDMRHEFTEAHIIPCLHGKHTTGLFTKHSIAILSKSCMIFYAVQPSGLAYFLNLSEVYPS